jgi:hypothetical protein
LPEIIDYLFNIKNNYDSINKISYKEELRVLKLNAITSKDEALANDIWRCETILAIQTQYIDAFNKMKQKRYYDAWCLLEVIEGDIHILENNMDIIDECYQIAFIKRIIGQYQSLFPYALFISPEFQKEEEECSICGKKLKLRDVCEHQVRKIYWGKPCYRLVKKMSLIGTAVVKNPVQKYSVIFEHKEDPSKYKMVEFVIKNLLSPYHDWKIEHTKRLHPYSIFKNTQRNNKCPCGSGKKYKKCCLNSSGVLMPHINILFEHPPKDTTVIYDDWFFNGIK